MKKYNLSACLIIKDEAKYIQECLEYHFMLGVEHFYIYDNESSDGLNDILAPYVGLGLVDYKYFPGKAMQIPAYNDCLIKAKEETIWLACIDTDEFILPVHNYSIMKEIVAITERAKKVVPNLGLDPKLLTSYLGGINLSWVYFGTSFLRDDPGGLVTETHLNRIAIDANDSWNKVIYFVDNINSIDNPHFTNSNKLFFDEDGEIVKAMPKSQKTKANHLRINHYTARNEAEHRYKLKEKGLGDGANIDPAYCDMIIHQAKTDFNAEPDYNMLRFIPALKQRLR